MLRRFIFAALIPAVALTACSKKKPVVVPTPGDQQPTTSTTRDPSAEQAARDAAERLRQDSIVKARAAADAAETERKMAALRTSLEQVVFFDYNEDKLRDDAAEILGQKVQILRANPGIRIRIVGHTDERGSVEFNQALGMRRAQVVKDYLTGFTIEEGRLEIVSMGEDQPQDPGHEESSWSRNRRAAFAITSGSILNTPGQ